MTRVGIGTEKGAWFLESDDGGAWEVTGPVMPGWRVTTFGRTPSGRYLMGAGSGWFGSALHLSDDLESWEQVVDGPAWPEGGDRSLKNMWTVTTFGSSMWVGVDDAGVFRSDDDGRTWQGVDGINEHESRSRWYPGAGGMAAHRILVDPTDPERMWVAISAAGVFRSADGGRTWVPRNEGVERTVDDDGPTDIGYCVHCLVADPDDADRIWRQDHRGVFRTTDGGDTWERIESGLPARFGFPIVRDSASGALFVVPQESDQHRLPVGGEFRVYRSTDGGDSWHPSGTGQPAGANYAGVLRGAMDTDGSGGVYLGTTSGGVQLSRDGGDTWVVLPQVFPRIDAVAVLDR